MSVLTENEKQAMLKKIAEKTVTLQEIREFRKKLQPALDEDEITAAEYSNLLKTVNDAEKNYKPSEVSKFVTTVKPEEAQRIQEEYLKLKTGFEPETTTINGKTCTKYTFKSEEEAQKFIQSISAIYPHVKFHTQKEMESLTQNDSPASEPVESPRP